MLKISQIFFILLLLLFSCSDESNTIEQQDGNSQSSSDLIQNINEEDNVYIQNRIEGFRYNNQDNIANIIKIKKYGEFYLIDYITKQGENENAAIKDLFDSQGVLNKLGDENTIVYCRGGCDCHLEGIVDGDNSYVQCSCSDCVMHISDHYPKNNTNKNSKVSFENLATKSFKRTFKSAPKNIQVISIETEKYKEATIMTITYQDDQKRPSTFMVVQNYYSETSNKVVPDFIIDCNGTCDCRERFYPATGAIECTCSECKMTVEEIPEDPE